MGIQVKGGFVVGNQEASNDVQVQERAVSTERVASRRDTRSVDSISEPSVVVNGKVKKISKQSAYLLDMMTLDDQ